MGRLNNSPNKKLKHFSHPHELEPCNNINVSTFDNSISTLCSCCKLPPLGDIYACNPCNFILHSTCFRFPELITHPSHPNHTLTLLPISSYQGGIFNCDACNSQGNGFSYHCSSCEYDLHAICASKPLKIAVQFHACPLELTFKNPYENAKGFYCDVCLKVDESKQWLYRCSSCEFDVHLDCIITRNPTPVNHGQPHFLQHNQSFTGANIVQNNQQINHGGLRPNSMTAGELYGAVRPNYLMHSSSNTGSLMPNMVQPTMRNNLINGVVEGVVEGASQQVGQILVQNMIGGSGYNRGGGEDRSSFLIGSIFGGSSNSEN